MIQKEWAAVDRYITDLLAPEANELDWLITANAAAGLPAIDVSPAQAKLLHLLVRGCAANQVLEIGTLGGYSAVWLARALPAGGRLVTLELEAAHAEVAWENLQRAGVADKVDLRVGPAVDSLADLVDSQGTPFDFVFVDADKPSYPDYLRWSLKLTRPGSLIVFDNVVRDGQLINAASDDPNVQGMRRLSELMAAEPHVTGTAIQTVGLKGYDGFAIALVTDHFQPS